MTDEERLRQLQYLKRIAESVEATTDIIASMTVDIPDKFDEVKLDKLTVTAQRYYKKNREDN